MGEGSEVARWERRREARWGRAKAFDKLGFGRRRAAAVLGSLEDLFLVASLGLLGLVLLAHLFVSMRVSVGFVAWHERLIRSFWFIERQETGEWGMWPGIVAALGQDAIFLGGVMLAVMIPMALVRRVIFEDERTVGEVVWSTVGSTVGILLATYLVGAIAGTFVMLVIAGAASADTPAEGLLAPVTSGILVTDLAFTTILWWDDRASSPRAPQMQWRGLAGAMVAFALYGLLATRPIAAHVELSGHPNAMSLYLTGDYVEHDGELVLRRVADHRVALDFDEGEWTQRGDIRAYGPGQPFFMSRPSFYHSPFSDTWLADGQTHVSYRLAAWTEVPSRSDKTVSLEPTPGESFFDQFEIVTAPDSHVGGTAVWVSKAQASPGLSWGLYLKGAGAVYLLAQGDEARLLEVGKPLVVLDRWKMGQPISSLGIVEHRSSGFTVVVDGVPRWVVLWAFSEVGAAMVRRPQLVEGDAASLRVTVDHAVPVEDAAIAEALRSRRVIFQ